VVLWEKARAATLCVATGPAPYCADRWRGPNERCACDSRAGYCLKLRAFDASGNPFAKRAVITVRCNPDTKTAVMG
jgi:hypothetical protein